MSEEWSVMMAPYIVCNKCGKKDLKEYRMELLHGPNGYRRYSVCVECAGGSAKAGGGRQKAAKRAKGKARKV